MRTSIAIAALVWLPLAHGQSITIDPGSSMDIDGSLVSVGCGDLFVNGVMSVGSGSAVAIRDVAITGGLSMGSGLISLSGSWSNAGSFDPGTGTVAIGDGCGADTSQMSGDSDFYNLSVTTTAGKLLAVSAGSTQTFANALTLTGTVSDRLLIRSSEPDSPAFFALAEGGTQTISAVDVADNDASGGQHLAPVVPAAVDSIDSGGTTNWFIEVFQGAREIDTLPKPALLALALLLMLLALRSRQKPALEKFLP